MRVVVGADRIRALDASGEASLDQARRRLYRALTPSEVIRIAETEHVTDHVTGESPDTTA